MKQHHLPTSWDHFLTRKLSGSVFTWQQIVNLTIPSILDSLSIMFINMLITSLISKNGESSVAAVSLVGPITGLIICVFSGIGAGGTVVVAQCCGKQEPVLLRRAVGMILWLTVLVGVIACLPFLLFPREILVALYPDAETIVLEKACTYLSGCVWSIVVFTLYTAIFAILRGLGESRKCLVLTIIINAAYLVLSFFFLNWLNMDIKGSVWALLLARIIGAAYAVVSLFFWYPPIALKLRQLFSYDHNLLRSTLQVSIPFGLEQLCISCGGIVSEMYMIILGTTALATHAVANSLMGVLTSASMSICNLSVTIVGRCIGAGRHDEAYMYGKRCNQLALLLIIVSALVFYPLMPLLLKQYHPTAEVYALSRQLLLASLPCLLLFWPLSYTLPGTLRAASDTLFPSIMSLCVLWLINIALGYYLAIPLGLGLWGVWIASWSSWMVRAAVFYIRFRSRKWLYKSKLKTAELQN